MLFLESPAFVGFSYSNSSEDRIVGDKRTAEDNRAFLLGWLKRFPQFRANPFWLSGRPVMEQHGVLEVNCSAGCQVAEYCCYCSSFVKGVQVSVWKGCKQVCSGGGKGGRVWGREPAHG